MLFSIEHSILLCSALSILFLHYCLVCIAGWIYLLFIYKSASCSLHPDQQLCLQSPMWAPNLPIIISYPETSHNLLVLHASTHSHVKTCLACTYISLYSAVCTHTLLQDYYWHNIKLNLHHVLKYLYTHSYFHTHIFLFSQLTFLGGILINLRQQILIQIRHFNTQYLSPK